MDAIDRFLASPSLSEATRKAYRFDLDAFSRECVLNGWDDVALTLRHEDAVAAHEARRPTWLPTTT